MKRVSKRIKKSEKSEDGILSYEIIDNTQNMHDLNNISSFEKPKEPIINSESHELISTEQKPINEKKNPVKTLVILIIIILLVDIVFLFAYVKPDIKAKLSSFFKPKVVDTSSSQCKDGTPYNSCAKNKPYYCYNGELLKSAYNCGCPSGYKVDFQDCKKI